MESIRSIISNVRSMHRLLSTDSVITDRAIASEIKSNALMLVKRETNLRKLWATDTLFTTIPCLEMVEVPISECCEYSEAHNIARSKYKIPRIAEGTYNYLIQGVYSINVLGGKGKKLKEISINRYLNLLNLAIKKNEEYFWINNDYLYITSSMVSKIRVSALFEESVPNDILHPQDCDCSAASSTIEDYCMNPLDRSFWLPGYLHKQVEDLTGESLMNTYFRIPQDITNEGIDSQQIRSTRSRPRQQSKDED